MRVGNVQPMGRPAAAIRFSKGEMKIMFEWWNGLNSLTQGFYAVAAFFSLIFLWQFFASMIGLSGGEMDVEVEADVDIDVGGGLDLDAIEAGSLEEAGETMAAFKVLSLRAIIAFCMLFGWAGGMYMERGVPTSYAILYATGWGLAGWLVVSLMMYGMRKLTESGTQKLNTCVGTRGSVYMDISAGGAGEVRVLVSGVISTVKARSAGGGEMKAGTPIRVLRMLGPVTVEVAGVDDESRKEG